MPGLVEANGPTYISSHSADVILSDIRPFKLKTDALLSINVLLDELLYIILSNSNSLVPDRLRASLLAILPTSLGKEALLEAEVELRAYWERTAASGVAPAVEDDTTTFHLQWTFELLRNKCEAYSTLNEADEDPVAESHINERFGRSGASSPKAALIAPAALYLTAILDRITISHLVPPNRRSYELLTEEGRFWSGNLIMTSSVGNGHMQNNPSRSSFEKSRALRMFSNGRTSEDNRSGHKKSASYSEPAKQASYEGEVESVEDPVMLQEFDDLMRSASTMKMSLTPDRLKTMEVYKQEKDQRRRPPALATRQDSEASSRPPPPPVPSSARQVESITEDDEEGSSPKMSTATRNRQGSFNTQPPILVPPNRSRSVSTSGAPVSSTARKPIRSPNAIPSSFPASLHSSVSNPNMAHTRSLHSNSHGAGLKPTAPPPRAPGEQKRVPKVSSTTRELMDFLAEGPPEMAGSRPGQQFTDFMSDGPPKTPGASSVSFDKPKTNRLQRMISKLNIGNDSKSKNAPPESPVKSPGHYRTANGAHFSSIQPGALSPLANRPIPPRPPKLPQPVSPPSSPSQASLADNNSAKSPPLPSHRSPVPPDQYRVPAVPSHVSVPPSPSRSPTQPQLVPKSIMKETTPPRSIPHANGNGHVKPVHAKASVPDTHQVPPPQQVAHSRSLTRKPVPNEEAVTPTEKKGRSTPPQTQAQALPPVVSEADLLDMQRLFASATTADECRLIFDMFMTRSKVGLSQSKASEPKEPKVPYPSPSPSLIKQSPKVRNVSVTDGSLEDSLVELLLGGGPSVLPSAPQPAQVQVQASPPVQPVQPVPGAQLAQPPSPPKARRLPRVPIPELNPSVHPAPAQQEKGKEKEKAEQENPAPWKNPSEFPTHAATLIPA
ncbi:hypothetical protein DFP72DRAFT_877843 [Ephemerocybe angulata]|uniref:Uncharacterized protein n=1 Tax=Ephemerocybe angulata TaxID=980116 RepID=A0A8H6IAP7_9AGAR|nr:hypothetical protein DFP72DRAFT_877843 [Tulosesus angulatus]